MEAAEPVLKRVVAFILQNQLIPIFAPALTPWIFISWKYPSKPTPRTDFMCYNTDQNTIFDICVWQWNRTTLSHSIESVSPAKRHESICRVQISCPLHLDKYAVWMSCMLAISNPPEGGAGFVVHLCNGTCVGWIRDRKAFQNLNRKSSAIDTRTAHKADHEIRVDVYIQLLDTP